MRTKLADLGNSQRHTFTGVFKKYGYKRYRNHYSPTLVLNNIQYNGSIVTDHLWFNLTKQFQKLGLLYEGDKIQFNARVNKYEKGYYLERELDYDLSYPTKIQLIESGKKVAGKELVGDDYKDGQNRKDKSNKLNSKSKKENQETEKDSGKDASDQVAETKSEKSDSGKKCVTDQRPEIPDDNNTIIGMIMNLNFDFYHINNRPLDNYYLDMFKRWQNKHPLGIKNHHLSNNENMFYASL